MERKQPVASGSAEDNLLAACSVHVDSSASVSIFCHLYLAVHHLFAGSVYTVLLITKNIVAHSCVEQCDLLRLLALLN